MQRRGIPHVKVCRGPALSSALDSNIPAGSGPDADEKCVPFVASVLKEQLLS